MKSLKTLLATALVAGIGSASAADQTDSLSRYQIGNGQALLQPAVNNLRIEQPRSSGRNLKQSSPQSAATALRSVGQQELLEFFRQRKLQSSRLLQRGGIDSDQQQALSDLAQTMPNQSDTLAVYFNRHNSTPSFVRFNAPAPDLAMRGDANELEIASSRQFLRNYRELFKLDDPDNELRLKRQHKDDLGNRHLLFQQMVGEVPVWGSELIVHLRDDLSPYLTNGRYQPSIKIDTQPELSPAEAKEAARDALDASYAQQLSSRLIVYPEADGSAQRLAYEIDFFADMGERWLMFVDAASGEVFHRIHNIQHATVDASGTTELGQTANFRAWEDSGTYYMVNPEVPTFEATPDPINNPPTSGDTVILDARNGEGDQLYFSTSNASNSGWDPTAVSAMDNTMKVYNYYTSTHGRDSVDGQGKNLQVAIHFKSNFNNAFWNGQFMVYGDGDGQTFNSLARCLDVAAHEMTHGVIETSANLKYENQSGALNESFADIFGVMVDRDDWTLGEDCTVAAPGYLRSMIDPSSGLSSQPSKMSEYQNLPNTPDTDNGGVHINSGIPNRAAYLIAAGLSDEGLGTSIGRGATESIFYRALTTYLTSSSQFIDARNATIQAAEDLYGTGSSEVSAVTLAWDLVEVTATTATPSQNTPTPTDPVSGDDWMVYIYPAGATNELYRQVMNTPLVYDTTLDNLIQNAVSLAANARPVAYTDQIGTLIFFVGTDFNVYWIDLNTPATVSQLTTSGTIWSIAVSPDGRFFTSTSTDGADNHIYVTDFLNNTSDAYPITPPDYQDGGSSSNTQSVLYADAMSFDYTSQTLVYDALNCISTETSSCASGGGYRYWSIGVMDVSSGQVAYPISAQSPLIDVAYPTFANNNSYVIATDLVDHSQAPTITSQVVTINFEDQQFALLHDQGSGSSAIFGTPSFWGDDLAVTLLVPDSSANPLAYRKQLNTGADGRWSAASASLEAINPYSVMMPLMHREGQRVNTGSVNVSSNQVNFGSINLGESGQANLTISNPGNSDINITGIQVNGSEFRHNGTNMLLTRGSSVTLALSFTPTSAGAKTASLSITSDTGSTAVALTGTAVSPDGNGGSSGGGGGALYLPLLAIGWLGWILLLPLRRRLSQQTKL